MSERDGPIANNSESNGRTSPTTGELSRLPPEILIRVLEELPRSALNSCLIVNSVFCSLALPLLYQHVKLSEFGPWPEFEQPSNPSSRASTPGPFDERTGTRPAYLSRSRLVDHVRRLDIVPHNTGVCGSSGLLHWWHALPPLPRLQVVRVFLMATWSGNRVFHTNVDAHDPDRQPDRNCAALTHLRSPTLVVRGLTLAHNTVPRHELPPRFEDSVRHFVAVFQPDHPYFLARNAERTAQRQGVLFRSRIPHLTTRMTVIFWPPGKSFAWRAGPGNHTLSWELIWSHASSLFSNLAAWMTQRQPHAHALTIVNVGALQRVDEDARETSAEMVASMRENVLDVFRAAVWDRFGDDERRAAAMRGVKVLSMEEWLAVGDEWRNVFDEQDVRPWLGSECGAVDVADLQILRLPHRQNRRTTRCMGSSISRSSRPPGELPICLCSSSP